jgi:hypothetical protein
MTRVVTLAALALGLPARRALADERYVVSWNASPA